MVDCGSCSRQRAATLGACAPRPASPRCLRRAPVDRPVLAIRLRRAAPHHTRVRDRAWQVSFRLATLICSAFRVRIGALLAL